MQQLELTADITIDAATLGQVEELSRLFRRLEVHGLAERFRSAAQRCLDEGLRSELLPAGRTRGCIGTVEVSIVGLDELVTAARAAVAGLPEIDLGHEGPHG